MKNRHAVHPLIIMALCSALLIGCGALEKNVSLAQFAAKRTVENNLFSSSFPEMKLQVDREFKYLGSVPLMDPVAERLSFHTDVAANIEATAYLFGQFDRENRIVRGVLIRVLVMQGDPSQEVPQIFAKPGYRILDSAEIKILEERYQSDLYAAQGFFTPKERELLGRGRVPSCLLVRQLSSKTGFGGKSRAQILYFEDVSDVCGRQACAACLDPAGRTAEQGVFVRGFTDRSYASIRFLKTRTVEDTTSRYMDAEPKAQPLPVPPPPVEPLRPKPAPERMQQPLDRRPAPTGERPLPSPVVAPPAERTLPAAPVIAEPGKAEALEKRLEALKRLYERNLISKEDYEKKKAELLKEL